MMFFYLSDLEYTWGRFSHMLNAYRYAGFPPTYINAADPAAQGAHLD